MKHLLKIALMMIAAITFGTSCNENNTKTTYSTFLTVVEGSWDIPYYLVFDDGTTATVENYKDWTPSFSEEWKELRYIVYYTETDLVEPGYDKVVNVTAYQPVSVSRLINVTEEDFTKEDGLRDYTADLDIIDAYFSPARNFMTLSVTIPFSDTSAKHTVKLVRNLSKDSKYKEHYVQDDYLWLEAYHDAGDDGAVLQASTHLCVKIDEKELGIGKLQTFYKGIKIIYPSYQNDSAVKVFTLEFSQQ